MNKIITIFLIVLIILGFLNNIIEYFRSKTTSRRRYAHNSFRHFNHIFIPLVFLIGAVWLYLRISADFPVLINISLGLLGSLLLILAFIPFYLYSNYMLHRHRVDHLVYNTENGILEIDGQPLKRSLISQIKWHKVGSKSLIVIWSNFEYAEIILKDGQRIIITSLLLKLKTLQKYFHASPVSYFYSLLPRIQNK